MKYMQFHCVLLWRAGIGANEYIVDVTHEVKPPMHDSETPASVTYVVRAVPLSGGGPGRHAGTRGEAYRSTLPTTETEKRARIYTAMCVQ